MTTPSAPPVTPDVEQASLPVETSRVTELLRLFGKAARAHQLYLPNNPVYKAAHDALRAGFLPIWEETGELVLSFTESEVNYGEETVLVEASRTSDSLPWIFYKDGVREIALTAGFETEELDRLLGILQRVRKANPDEDDLLTLLWQGDYAFLRYRYVDVTMESSSGATALSDGGEMVAQQTVDTRASVAEDAQAAGGDSEMLQSSAARPGVISMTDFDATLYFLDDKEIEYLQSEVKREYDADLRQNVVAMLFDIFEQQPDPIIREETAAALESLMLHMLSVGQFQTVAYLVRESQVAVQRAIDISAEQRERLAFLPSRLSAPEALTQLLQSIDDAPELPPTADLLELFEQLRAPALATVLDWLGRLQNMRLRPLLEQAAARLAAQNTAELVKLVGAPNRGVALEAIKRAGALRSPAAVAPAGKVLADSGDAPLRAAAVQALNEIGSPSAMQWLERALDDADRDVRLAAVRALQAKAYRPALARLDAIIKGKSIRDADLSEKMAVFEAYGTLCGEAGVAALDATLNGKSLFGRRDDPELRACAAVALGRIGTSSAQEALRRSTNAKDVVVRNAVARALRGPAI